MKRLGLLVSLALLTPTLNAAGWTQPAGAAYAKLWWRSLVGDRVYFADGSSDALPERYLDQALNLYAEVGLLDELTLVAYANPFGYAKYGDESVSYVGNLQAGLRYGLALGDARLAVEGHYGYAPDIGEEDLVRDPKATVVYVPTFETHRADGELQLGYPLPFGWVAASAGYRWYSREHIDPAVYGFAQLGWSPDPFTLDFHLNLHEPLGDVDLTNVAGAGQTRYLGVGVGASWWFVETLALAFGFEGVAYAQSNAATPTMTLGLEWKAQ